MSAWEQPGLCQVSLVFMSSIWSYGYGSIPINTIFNGMNFHLPAILMFTRGTRFWHTAIFGPGFSSLGSSVTEFHKHWRQRNPSTGAVVRLGWLGWCTAGDSDSHYEGAPWHVSVCCGSSMWISLHCFGSGCSLGALQFSGCLTLINLINLILRVDTPPRFNMEPQECGRS